MRKIRQRLNWHKWRMRWIEGKIAGCEKLAQICYYLV